MLNDFPVRAELTAVCDLSDSAREWFRQVPTVRLLTANHRELLASPEVDAVYVAVPHHLHEPLYLDVLAAGKDLLAEKPFGIDLAAARKIADAAERSGRFVRCSSEFPFLPGAQRAFQYAREGHFGKLLEIHSGFHHSSDLDPTKPANWKRQVKTCGEIGVMGDLGMHAVHLPFRIGWRPKSVYAQLQKVYHERPDGRGGTAVCDTWDNALLHTEIEADGRGVSKPSGWPPARRTRGSSKSWARTAACASAPRSRSHSGFSSAVRNNSGSARTSVSMGRSPRSRAGSSSRASRIACCKCGRRSSPSAPASWTAASAA